MTRGKSTLTQRQQIALGYISCTKKRNLQIAIGELQGDVHMGNAVPEWLAKKIAKQAIKQGETTSLRQVYEFWIKTDVPKTSWITCGKNAIKNLMVYHAIEAYGNASTSVPKKSFLKMGEDLLSFTYDDVYRVDDGLAVYKHLNVVPLESVLLNLIFKIRANYELGNYFTLCKALNAKPEQKFIQQCFDHYLENLNPDGVEYAAEILKKKLSKKVLINFGKKAFAKNKTDEGREFFKLAYN